MIETMLMAGSCIDINPDDPASVRRALCTEWLLTNGLGGYAMGTALGANTRRYHGLLIAAAKPPVGRILVLHSVIEQLALHRSDASIGDVVADLSTQQFVGPGPDGAPVLHPQGWRRLRSFDCDPPHDAAWELGGPDGTRIQRALRLRHGTNECHLSYAWSGGAERRQAGEVRVRPLIALRDFHDLTDAATEPLATVTQKQIRVRQGAMELAIDWDPGGSFTPDPQWWFNVHYQCDRARGQEYRDHVWSPGVLHLPLKYGRSGFSARLCHAVVDDAEEQSAACTAAHAVGCGAAPARPAGSHAPPRLHAAARQFVVARAIGAEAWACSVIAGYPWFGDWGRDTMIALPGLMLCAGRLDEARSCLLLFAKHVRNGLIPNLFDEHGGAAHYNTVDAPLWFVHAVHEYCKAAKSPALELLAACRQIVDAYRRGTEFDIRMDGDGLISAGNEATQLTWMDAKRDGVVFTPRHGKAVEINALWHNALLCLAAMSDEAVERRELQQLACTVAQSVRTQFWWSQRQCLHDCLRPGTGEAVNGCRAHAPDGKLRPNQIFAASLPFSPLDQSQRRAVVVAVGARLLTPYGLRTLDRDDPDYHPRFEGNLFERDRAYHNGTVWPWLIGPYCEALLRVEGFSGAARQRVRELVQPLLSEMESQGEPGAGRCIGQLAEVYDGDPPHRPGGCPAQAWSVAEVLRILTMIGEGALAALHDQQIHSSP